MAFEFLSTEPGFLPYFQMAPWIASRSYAIGTGEARSAVANERRHEFLVLENESAELWSRIEKGITHDDLLALAQELEVAESLPTFLQELAEADLVSSLKHSEVDPLASQFTTPAPKPLEQAANTGPEHDMMRWVAEHGYLYHAFWEITYRCNESCVHCWNPGAAHLPDDTPRRQTEELTTEEAFRLLEELADVGVFRLTLTGGEVFLRNDLFEIVARARSLSMSVELYTNGLLLTAAVIDRLASLWPAGVGISIYSADPAVHDEITRVAGSFAKSVAALQRLRDRGIKTYLKSIQMQHTLQGFQKVAALATELGSQPQIDLQMSAGVDGADAPSHLAAQDPAELIVMAATPGSQLFVGTAASNYGCTKKDMQATACGAGIGTMSIDPTGAIVPCASLPIANGTFREQGFKELWRRSTVGSRMKDGRNGRRSEPLPSDATVVQNAAVLAAWQNITLKDYHECGTHDRCGWCTKCPGLAMLEHGDALAPSTVNCRLASARMEAARLLKAGLDLAEIRRLLGVADDFGHASIRRPLPLIQVATEGQAAFDPRTSGTAQFIEDAAVSPCGNCGSGSCGSPGYHPSRADVSFDGSPGLELNAGSKETAEALRAFTNLRNQRLARIPL